MGAQFQNFARMLRNMVMQQILASINSSDVDRKATNIYVATHVNVTCTCANENSRYSVKTRCL